MDTTADAWVNVSAYSPDEGTTMLRLVLLVVLCGSLVGFPLCADDPPKKLTPEQRKELEAKCLEHLFAAGLARQGGKINDAIKSFEEAVRVGRQLYTSADFPNGDPKFAGMLTNLAILYREHDRLPEAEPHFKEALAVNKRLYQGDHREVANSLNDLAVLYQDQGKLDAAEPFAKEALDMFRRLHKGDHRSVVTSLNNLAGVYESQEKFREAESLYKDALAMERRLVKEDNATLANHIANLAGLYRLQGKLAEAEPLYKESLEMKRRLFNGDHLTVARSLSNLAELYRNQGKLGDAEPLSRDALAMFRRLFKGDHPDVATTLNNLAALYQEQGKLAEAEPLKKDSLAMTRRLFPGDHRDVANSLSNLAFLYQEQGKLAEAEPLYMGALAMFRRLFKGDHPDVAASLNNLAELAKLNGKLAEAEALFDDALAMHLRLFKREHPAVAESLNNVAQLRFTRGKPAEAEPLAKEAVEIFQRLYPNGHSSVARSLNNLAFVYQAQGKLDAAELLMKDALKMWKRLIPDDHPFVAISLGNLGGLYHSQGKLADAELLYRDAYAMHRRLIVAYAKLKAEGETLTLLESQPATRDAILSVTRLRSLEAAAPKAPASTYAAIWLSKGTVARVFEQRQLRVRTLAADPALAELVAELTDARRRRAELLLTPATTDAATLAQRESELKRHEETIANLDRHLAGQLPPVARLDKLDAATLADLQKALPGDAALVDYFHYVYFQWDQARPAGQQEKRTLSYLAFVVTKDKVSWVDLETAEQIESAVAAWREAITSGKEIPSAVPAKVRELVWEKVRKELPANIKTVYIAPDVALCRVPWGAIPGDKPGTILLEDYAIATIPHATFLLDKIWPQDPIKNPPTGALVVGGVNFDAEATTGPVNRDLPVRPGTKIAWQALPGAAAEAAGVESAAKKKGAVTMLKGEAATPAAVLAALPRARYAHFATHGFFADPSFRSAFQLDEKDFERTRRGERIGRAALSPLVMTGLVFAGANNPKTPGRGIVTGEALVDLDLSGLELAVLSACETGLGDVAGGEGTFGLQRAFHLAGTRDVIASLWKVPDAPTAALMAEFYRNLWERNLSPMESLRQAQLTIYRNPDRIAELAAGFRAGFKEVPGTETAVKPTAAGKSHPRLWAAFTLSGPGR